MLVFIYSLLIKGTEIKNFLFKIIPLQDEVVSLTFDRFNQMNFVTLVCNGIGGIIQGVSAGFIFFICGIESIFLWTVVMIILAFIPLVGISIISVPAGIYLIITGNTFLGIFLITACALIAFAVENFFKPKFTGNRVKIDPILLLFGILGGLSYFGMAGIFYGPIIIAMFLNFVQILDRTVIQKGKFYKVLDDQKNIIDDKKIDEI